ncbi:hypothetical protein FRB97_004403, partial [Tulasnella sp. 331]
IRNCDVRTQYVIPESEEGEKAAPDGSDVAVVANKEYAWKVRNPEKEGWMCVRLL